MAETVSHVGLDQALGISTDEHLSGVEQPITTKKPLLSDSDEATPYTPQTKAEKVSKNDNTFYQKTGCAATTTPWQ